ncbi:MAG: Oligopeptide transport system permease protein OppC [Pseudomonadota bacterium]|jgi:peptide/nickel transport system permease protein
MSQSVWQLARRRFLADRVGVGSLAVVLVWLLLVLLTGLGFLASHWAEQVAVSHAPPSLFASGDQSSVKAGAPGAAALADLPVTPTDIEDPIGPALAQISGRTAEQDRTPTATEILDPIADGLTKAEAAAQSHRPRSPDELAQSRPLGADKWGRDILDKTLKGAETSILVGLAAALVAVVMGTVLGAVSGWFGGWVDDLTNWVYNVFNAIPNILLILAIAAVLGSKGSLAVVIILGVTGWTGTYRLVRGEYLKHREREYVRAADAMGASSLRRMFVHILPNVSHVILVQFSILTVACIKAEVILSFLGFGVPVDGVSWGTMLTEAQNDLLVGIWWQLTAATVAMAIFVTALSLLTDSLRDALDPKLTH